MTLVDRRRRVAQRARVQEFKVYVSGSLAPRPLPYAPSLPWVCLLAATWLSLQVLLLDATPHIWPRLAACSFACPELSWPLFADGPSES